MERTLLVAFSLLFAACATFREPRLMEPIRATCEEAPAAISAVTWNVGLGPGIVALSTPRAPAVAEAVSRLDADVMCVQEAWTDADRDAIVRALGLPPENVLTADTVGVNEFRGDTCSMADIGPLLSCVREKCEGVAEEDMSLCGLSSCKDELRRIYFRNSDCLTCLASASGKSAEEIRRTCTGPGASRIYEGRNGVILASRWPLLRREAVLLPAGGANRVALFATVDVPGAGPVELACTHISSPQEIPPSHSPYGDWEDEQKAQVRIISDRLRERAEGRPQLFIGDINAGRRDGPDIRDASIDVWETVIRAGFVSPAGYAAPPFCSACRGNSLRGSSWASTLIDHVLLRDPPGGTDLVPVCADRLFDAPVTVTGYRGEPATTHLSDHYAVRVKFAIRAPAVR